MTDTQPVTTRERAETWDVVNPLLIAMHAEYKDLSRKKPDSVASKQKVAMTNRLLARCKSILTNDAADEFLDLLDQDQLPQISDVVIVLSQYVAAMSQFRHRHADARYGNYYWRTGDLYIQSQGEDEEDDHDDDDGAK